MARRCEDCGFSVTVGQGKWAGDMKNKILRHKAVELCQEARESTRVKSRALAQARSAKSGGRTEWLSGDWGIK